MRTSFIILFSLLATVQGLIAQTEAPSMSGEEYLKTELQVRQADVASQLRRVNESFEKLAVQLEIRKEDKLALIGRFKDEITELVVAAVDSGKAEQAYYICSNPTDLRFTSGDHVITTNRFHGDLRFSNSRDTNEIIYGEDIYIDGDYVETRIIDRGNIIRRSMGGTPYLEVGSKNSSSKEE